MQHGFVIPVYNHGDTLEGVVSALQEYNLPIIIVDDGNDAENKAFINKVVQSYSNITLVTNKRNLGKGGAVRNGMNEAYKMGLTHAFQIDADGQHDIKTCRAFLDESIAHPDFVICGCPEFDESIPNVRLKARDFGNNYARYVALSDEKELKDVQCGYRIYPVEHFYKICRHAFMDNHMAFDIEILVRFIWRGVPLIFKPVKVSYPVGGKSNFHVVRDNIYISLMFTRLTIGMWLRYPILCARKRQKSRES